MEIYEKLRDPVAFTVFMSTLFLPILVGFIALRRTKNQSDFFIGGRAMNKFVVALSAVSSGRSSWLVLGVSGIAYMMGCSAVWAAVGYITVEMFQFIYIGRKLRAQTEVYNSITILDYFESRFKDKYLLRITGAIIIIIFITAYVAAQFYAGAKSLSTALGISGEWALIISATLILVYMVLGGYIAVAYNDVVRAIIMIIGLVILPIVGLIKIGGFRIFIDLLTQLNPAYIDPFSLSIGAFLGFVGIGLGSPGQPHIVVRYMSIDHPEQLRFATVIGTFWNVIMAWGAVFIGLLGRILIPNLNNLPDGDSEMVYLVLASKYFGPLLYGLLVGGIFAAILSTADSQLLVVASTFVRDIYEKIFFRWIKKKRPGMKLTEAKKLMLSRWVVLASGIIAIILAYAAKDAIFWLVLFAWGGLGASFGAAIIFTLYWKKTSKYGIFSGFLMGTIVTIIWKLFLKNSTGIYELIPAFFGSVLVIVIVSLITNRKEIN